MMNELKKCPLCGSKVKWCGESEPNPEDSHLCDHIECTNADCGGEVVWIGPITNLSHTECKQCGAINNYLNEQGEDDLQSNEIAMMKIKTSKLTGRALNYAVALAVGGYELIPVPPDIDGKNEGMVLAPVGYLESGYTFPPKGGLRIDFFVKQYSSDWCECGELINNYWIDLMFEEVDGVNYCYASPPHLMGDYATANIAQEAICRAVVMLEIGNEVEIPEELINVN
ncbi:TPA: hypothetical protein KET99_000158 [Proteus mirabilis]|nr:hypothetical protein [Proteus mirabilis]